MSEETREDQIARWEREGWLDPTCPGCRIYYGSPGLPVNVFSPSHQVSDRCESGKLPHCTCDTCF